MMYMYLCECMLHAQRDGKRALYLLMLELQAVVRHLIWALGMKLASSGKVTSALNG